MEKVEEVALLLQRLADPMLNILERVLEMYISDVCVCVCVYTPRFSSSRTLKSEVALDLRRPLAQRP